MHTGIFSGPTAAWELPHLADSVESPWAEVLRAEGRAVMTAVGPLNVNLQIFLQRRRNKPSSLGSKLAKNRPCECCCVSTCTYVYGTCMIHSWGATLVSSYIYFSLCAFVYSWARVCHMLLRMSEEAIFCYIQTMWAASVVQGMEVRSPGRAARVSTIEPSYHSSSSHLVFETGPLTSTQDLHNRLW